jgi:ABC-2 type transport system permease protein
MNRTTLFWRAVRGRALPRLKGSMRAPTWVFYETLLPLLATAAFVFVYRALGAPQRFVSYVIMGGAAVAFWMNVLWNMAAQFYWEKRNGNLDVFLISPCGINPILIGMSLGGILATLVRAVAVVAIGTVVFHASFDLSRLPALAGVFALSLVALYGLGATLASLFLYWGRESWHVAQLFTEPVLLVSGVYFPVHALGFGVGLVGSAVPLTLALDALRQLLLGPAHPALFSLPVEVGGLAGLAVAYVAAAHFALSGMERLSRREGRLSRRY